MVKIVGLMIMIILLLGALVDVINGVVNMMSFLWKGLKKIVSKIGCLRSNSVKGSGTRGCNRGKVSEKINKMKSVKNMGNTFSVKFL